MASSNRRQPPPRVSATSPTPPNGSSSNGSGSGGSSNGAAAPKPKKPRKTDDELIAEYEAKAAGARERKALKAISENKPLAKAVKAAGTLRKWLPAVVALAVDAHIKRLVAANATSGDTGAAELADKMLGSQGDAVEGLGDPELRAES